MEKIVLGTQCHDEEIVVSTCNDLVVVSVVGLHKLDGAAVEMSVAQARDLMNALSEAIADAGRDKR